MSDHSPETVVDSRNIFDGRRLRLRLDTIRHESGRLTTREIVEHPGAVAMVVPDSTGRVAMVRQWRAALQRWTLEIPAGTREPNEPAEDCARRELSEEMGLYAENWEHLVDVYTSPGWCNELIQVFLATDLSPTAGSPEEDETIEREWIDLAAVSSMIAKAQICDAKSIAGLLLYLQKARGG